MVSDAHHMLILFVTGIAQLYFIQIYTYSSRFWYQQKLLADRTSMLKEKNVILAIRKTTRSNLNNGPLIVGTGNF